MPEYHSNEKQAPHVTQEVFVDRVLHGTKAIAEYMGVSPGTISRWRTRYRGREEFRLCFPAILMPTGKGWGFRMISSTVLIRQWMERWWQINAAAAQEKAKSRRRTRKTKRLGETSMQLETAPTEEKRPESTREEPCPCGVPSRCLIHHEPFYGDGGLTLQEERASKIETRPEPLPGPPPVIRPAPRIQRPEGCTCGTATPCHAHD